MALGTWLAVVMLLANGLIFSGLAFINGRLLPSVFGGVYAAVSSHNLRLLMALLTFFFLANLLFAWGYRHAGAGLAGTLHLTTGVVIMLINALVLDGTRLTTLSFIGASVMIVGGILVVQGLQPTLSVASVK